MIVRYSLMWDEEREEYIHRYEALAQRSGRIDRNGCGKGTKFKLIVANTTTRDDKLAAQYIRHQLLAAHREERLIQPLPIPDPKRFKNIEIG